MNRSKKAILKDVDILMQMYAAGKLGGEIMPEDVNPGLDKFSNENYLYFTLPMALNYRRNSYKLWESATATYNDQSTRFVYDPKAVVNSDFLAVQTALTKYNLALLKTKQTEIWIKLCQTIEELFAGDIRQLFMMFNNDVVKIRDFIQKTNKPLFPYLSGTKICNYWLYVIYQYCGCEYLNIGELTVAPDTHVVKATQRLGLITEKEMDLANKQELVIERWNSLFKGTSYKPIDIHTPLWLWSRGGFIPLDEVK